MATAQDRAHDALQPLLVLSASANSPSAAVQLIKMATSAPNAFFFAELLETANIQSLKHGGEQYAPWVTLLEIFSWATWRDYESTPNLPALDAQQAHKLRLLTLLTLASESQTLSYSHLQHSLSLTSIRSLEDLVISAIDAGLLTAKLSPATSSVLVTSTAPVRDLAPGSSSKALATLAKWNDDCGAVLDYLDEQAGLVRAQALERKRRAEEIQRAAERVAATMGAEKGSGKRAAADGGWYGGEAEERGPWDDAMDLDDGNGERGGAGGAGQRKNAKTRFGGIGRRLGA